MLADICFTLLNARAGPALAMNFQPTLNASFDLIPHLQFKRIVHNLFAYVEAMATAEEAESAGRLKQQAP